MAGVTRDQRYTRTRRCPVCGGAETDPRGAGKRCTGYLSPDGRWARCSRDETAGLLAADKQGLYVHAATGPCKCGTEHAPSTRTSREEEAHYDYLDEDGHLLFRVVRFVGKEFRQKRPDPSAADGWAHNLQGVRRVLYKLPELIAAGTGPIVWIGEGEKDVDALRRHGFVATCNPHGAEKWGVVRSHAAEVLGSRNVVIVADKDDVGRRHAQQVAAALHGEALSVRIVEVDRGKDAADFFGAGGTPEELTALMHAAPYWSPAPPDDDAPWPPEHTNGVHLNGAAKIEPAPNDPMRGLEHLPRVSLLGRQRILERAKEPVPWVWQDIAVGATITLMAGGPGEGKTTLLFLVLAARLTMGPAVRVLGREVKPAPEAKWTVLIEGEHGERSAARKLVKSMALLDVNDAALDRVIIVARKAVRLGSPEWGDVERLVRAGLVSDIAIDTVARVAPADGNDEREQVAIFDQVAQTIDTAPTDADKPVIWGVAHTRKNGAGGDVADVSGSTQRTGQADTVMLVKGEKVNGRTVSSTVTFVKIREDPEEYPQPVTFAIVGGKDGEPRVIVGDGKDDPGEPLERRVVKLLATGPKTKTTLARELGRSKEDVDDAITLLFEKKCLRTTTIHVKGREWKAFELRSVLPPSGPAPEDPRAPD